MSQVGALVLARSSELISSITTFIINIPLLLFNQIYSMCTTRSPYFIVNRGINLQTVIQIEIQFCVLNINGKCGIETNPIRTFNKTFVVNQEVLDVKGLSG